MPSLTTGFESLLEAVPDALLGVDRSGVIQFVNRQGESMFGYEREDLIGVPMETLVPESARQVHVRHQKGYTAARRTRPVGARTALRGRRRDGTRFPVDVALSPMDTADGMLVVAAVRDMTGYRSAEEDRRRADRLRAVVEHSGDAVIGTTRDGIITSWNPAAEKAFGYSGAEILGRSNGPLTPQDRSHELMAIRVTVRAGQSVRHLETIGVRKDGAEFPVSLSVSPVADRDGAVIGASTVVRDVSQAQGALRAARVMIETSLDSLVAISPEGRITDANEATVRLTGVPRDKLIGTSFSDYFTDPEGADRVYQQVLGQEPAADHHLTMRQHNAREGVIEVLYNASAYRDAGGNLLGVFAAARDVTDQRKAAQYARSLIEATPDALVAIGSDGKVTDVNEAMVRLTGVPRGQLIGSSFSGYFTEPARAEEIYRRVFTQGMAVDYPLTLRSRDGVTRQSNVLFNASVYFDSDGAVLGVVAAARDVTSRSSGSPGQRP